MKYIGIVISLLVVVGGGFIFGYTQFSSKELNLAELNRREQYQTVIDITDQEIKDQSAQTKGVDFWNHRGFAFYKLGRCAEAGAAFGHVVLQDFGNEVASSFLAALGSDSGCSNASQAAQP